MIIICKLINNTVDTLLVNIQMCTSLVKSTNFIILVLGHLTFYF